MCFINCFSLNHLSSSHFPLSDPLHFLTSFAIKYLNTPIPLHFYSISKNNIISAGGKSLLRSVNNSTFILITKTFPEFQWLPWLFRKTLAGFWNERENRDLYFRWLQDHLNFSQPYHLYSITQHIIQSCHGSGLLSRYYNNSPAQFVRSHMPNYDWKPWKFTQMPSKFWCFLSNHIDYFDWLRGELKHQVLDDCYGLILENFQCYYGDGLLCTYYDHCVFKFISSLLPFVPWFPWKFARVPRDFWTKKSNHTRYFEWLKEELKIEKANDWLKYSRLEIVKNYCGGSILQHYNDSYIHFVLSQLPHHKWEIWRFANARGVWQDNEKHKQAFQCISRAFEIEDERDWLSMSIQIYLRENFSGLLKNYDNCPMTFILHHMPTSFQQCYFKEIERLKKLWTSEWNFYSEHQYNVFIQKSLFPTLPIFSRQKIEEDNYKTEIDIFVPDAAIGFEYQGEQHYVETGRVLQEMKTIQVRDKKKETTCSKRGITLIIIPFWFGNIKEGETHLFSLLSNIRPDINCKNTQPKTLS